MKSIDERSLMVAGLLGVTPVGTAGKAIPTGTNFEPEQPRRMVIHCLQPGPVSVCRE